MTKTLSPAYKICYVTLTEPFKSLVEELKEKNANLNKFFFIDCISVLALQNLGKMTNIEAGTIWKKGVVYVSNPRALDLLMVELNQVLTSVKPDIIIFDSLTALVSYCDPARVLQAIHNLILPIKLAGCKLLLPCAQEEKDQAFVKDIEMFVDETVNLS